MTIWNSMWIAFKEIMAMNFFRYFFTKIKFLVKKPKLRIVITTYHFGGIGGAERSLKTIVDYMPENEFYIFADDIEWCQKNFSWMKNKSFITGNTVEQDFELMKNCKHNLLHMTKGCYLQKVKDSWSLSRWELTNQTENMLSQTLCWHPSECESVKR